MTPDDNTLVRSVPCALCSGQMLWTQAAWREPGADPATVLARAAYTCMNGHIIDPAETPQCPTCGVHDTSLTDRPSAFACRRCGARFTVPR
jgi:hypothetical protein